MQLAMLIAVLFSSGLASAEVSGPEVKKHFDAGNVAYGACDYSKAASEFTQAYELSSRMDILFNVGQSYEAGDDLKRAERTYETILARSECHPSDDACPRLIAAVRERLQFVQGRINEKAFGPWLPPPAPKVFVTQSQSVTTSAAIAGLATPSVEASPLRARPWHKKPVGLAFAAIGLGAAVAGSVLVGETFAYDDRARGAMTLNDERASVHTANALYPSGIAVLSIGGASLMFGGILLGVQK